MNTLKVGCVAALAMAAGASQGDVEPTWTTLPTTAGGHFYYNGTPQAVRPSYLEGDQTLHVQEPRTVQDFFPGQSDTTMEHRYWQIFTGATITATGHTRFMCGNIALENAVVWKGNDQNWIGYTAPTKLILRNGGSLAAPDHSIKIGKFYKNEYPNGYATVYMEEPSALEGLNQQLCVGYDMPGALWIDGGVVSVTNNSFVLGSSESTSDGGYVRLNGGEIVLRAENAADFIVGNSSSYSSLHVSGGQFRLRRPSLPDNIYSRVGNGANVAADVYVDGGFVDLWNASVGVGAWNTGISGGRASWTVSGGRVRASTMHLGGYGDGNTATLNLNGGRFELGNLILKRGNAGNEKYINFDGGTLAFVPIENTEYKGYLDGTIDQKVVYPGGATIEIPPVASAIDTDFRQATGYGVSEIVLTNPGSGYVTAPKVTLSGGSGSRATAYAVLNKDRTLEKIVVTCRGEGYAADDNVTVTISSSTGSGAAATATLASNAGGSIRKTGQGEWVQRNVDNTFTGDIEIAEGRLRLTGKSFTSLSKLRMDNDTTLRPARGSAPSSVNNVHVQNGLASIDPYGWDGVSSFHIGTLSVDKGIMLVARTNTLVTTLTATDLTETSSSASPVVNGLVYANKEVGSPRSPLPMQRQGDGTLIPVQTTLAIGPDANWVTGNATAIISEANAETIPNAVNSIIMPRDYVVNRYVRNTGLVEVKSGMIVVQRPNADCQRIQITGGGAFTTRAKGGMIIYSDNSTVGKRSPSMANEKAVHFGEWRRLFGPFADPDGSTPMSLTIAGEKQSRPELGAQAWLLVEQRFSGGLNLVNGGVFIVSDNGLGASGSPVHACGYCSIATHNWTFNVTHPIELLEGSALIFSPSFSNQGNTISSALSGSGNLLTSDINRPSYAMAFTGDHSAFTGDYYIQGHARISPSVFSVQAGICLADGTSGVGVIETSGSFTRPAGTGKGEVCWKTHPAYTNLNYGLRGGFAAKGGDLTVNLGGAGAKLAVGSDYLPEGTVVQLQSQYADGALTFMNGFELGGKTQTVNVWSGKTATFAGALSDAVGGGALAVTGNLALDGATLEIGAANLAAPMLAVSGTLTLAGTLNLALDPTCVEGLDEIPLATATGGVSGTPTVTGNVPSQWALAVRSNSLVLKKLNGTMLIFR